MKLKKHKLEKDLFTCLFTLEGCNEEINVEYGQTTSWSKQKSTRDILYFFLGLKYVWPLWNFKECKHFLKKREQFS